MERPERGGETVVTEVQSFMKEKDSCGCLDDRCTAYGTLKKPNRDGTRCVARLCVCRRCTGRNNRKRGLDKQRKAAKALGVTGYVGNEEQWQSIFRNEVKADLLSAKVVGNAWSRIVAQIDANRPDFGDDHRPARITVMPPGWGPRGIVMVETETWRTLIGPALTEFYGPGDAA